MFLGTNFSFSEIKKELPLNVLKTSTKRQRLQKQHKNKDFSSNGLTLRSLKIPQNSTNLFELNNSVVKKYFFIICKHIF